MKSVAPSFPLNMWGEMRIYNAWSGLEQIEIFYILIVILIKEILFPFVWWPIFIYVYVYIRLLLMFGAMVIIITMYFSL